MHAYLSENVSCRAFFGASADRIAGEASLAFVLLAAVLTIAPPALAADATWLASPADGDFNNAANWSGGAVPDGIATFGASSVTTVTFSGSANLGGFTFASGAPAYTFINNSIQTVIFTGAGIVNGSAATFSIDNGSAMEFRQAASAGSATINVNNLLPDNGSTVLSFWDTASAKSSTITNNFQVLFANASTAGDATLINNSNGLLQFWQTASAQSATITNDGTLLFAHDSTAGAAAITNNQDLYFQSNSTAGTATITNNGSLTFFGTSTAANAAITTLSGGTVSFLNTASGGDARFITEAGGSFSISGISSTGTTAGSIEGAGNHVLGAKSLTVGSNDLSTEVSGVISGAGGSLAKTGSGILTLSGANTYTGATTVNDGTLAVNGSIASSSLTTVNPGGTLGGTGAVGNASINGGTLAPGNSIGTLTVNGNLTLAPGSSYAVEFSSASADRTNVSGIATLDGTVDAAFLPGGSMQRSYTILSAAGGLGGSTFDAVTSNLSPSFTASLAYSGNDVILNLAASGAAAVDDNQRRVGDAISAYFNNEGSLPPEFASVLNLTGEAQKAALSQVSGESSAAAQAGVGQASTQFLGAMFAPRVAGPVNAMPTFGPVSSTPVAVPVAYAMGDGLASYGSEPQQWTNWVSVFGGVSHTSGAEGQGSHDVSAHAYGFAAGLDYQATPSATLGFAFSGGNSSWGLSNGLGGGESQDFQIGLNGAVEDDDLYGMAALSYGFHRMSTERYAPGGSRLAAQFDAQSLGGRLEGGMHVQGNERRITPYAAVEVQSFLTPAYGEDDPGGSGYALSYAERTSTTVRAELGARFEHAVPMDNERHLKLDGRLAYAHDWITDPSVSASFQALPGAAFTVSSATPPRNLALASLGAELFLDKGLSLSARFEGEFSGRSTSAAGIGVIRMSW
jgi:autotransporter-associated beta strand protein